MYKWISHRSLMLLLLSAAVGAAATADEQKTNEQSNKATKEAKAASDSQKKQRASANTEEGPIRLQSIFVGDKEQPAISYFIPWQGVGAPDKLHWNMEEMHDQSLKPVDRDIMLRSIQLYEDLQMEGATQ